MDRPARTLSGSLMPRVLSHAYVWVPIMAPDTFSCPLCHACRPSKCCYAKLVFPQPARTSRRVEQGTEKCKRKVGPSWTGRKTGIACLCSSRGNGNLHAGRKPCG
jgi:hypothetical protein